MINKVVTVPLFNQYITEQVKPYADTKASKIEVVPIPGTSSAKIYLYGTYPDSVTPISEDTIEFPTPKEIVSAELVGSNLIFHFDDESTFTCDISSLTTAITAAENNAKTYAKTYADTTKVAIETLETQYRTSTLQDAIDLEMQGDISTIKGKIPSQATSENQLADKNFVNSSIQSAAANYVTADASGNSFATRAALLAGPYYHSGSEYTPKNNDYAMVEADETHDNKTSRYSYTGTWNYLYSINATFTQAQQAALDSGITSGKVATYDAYASLIASKQDAITGSNKLGASLVDDTNSSNKFVSSQDKINWDSKSTVSIGTAEQASAAEAKTITVDGNTYKFGGGTVIGGKDSVGNEFTVDNGYIVVPKATPQGSLGMVRFYSGDTFGVGVDNSGNIYVGCSNWNDINTATNIYKPIVPSKMGLAVKKVLGNTITNQTDNLTWDATEKANARNTIGASEVIFIDFGD